MMVDNCIHMISSGVIIELLDLVYSCHSSSLQVRNNESFEKRERNMFSVISMMVMNGLNQILEYLIIQVRNFQ